jgi:Cellulose binding domain
VTNSGTAATTGYSWPGSQTISQIWSASNTQSGAAVDISNLSYDGAIPAGGSTTFGTGTAPSSLSNLTCTAH